MMCYLSDVCGGVDGEGKATSQEDHGIRAAEEAFMLNASDGAKTGHQDAFVGVAETLLQQGTQH